MASSQELMKRYAGTVTIDGSRMSENNRWYWSIGTRVNGRGYIKPARQCVSSGVSQADYRLCTYEDGSPIIEDGKLFFCVSSRLSGLGQTVYAYHINTCEFELVGCLLGYQEDGELQGLIAPHILYDRNDGYWYVFAHWGSPHNISVGKTIRDPRYGYNEVTCHVLDYESPARGDEDSFVYYDKELCKYVMVYSKASTELFKQVSDHIDGGYKLVARNHSVASLTGINVVWMGDKRYIVSGFGSPGTDGYKVFDLNDLSFVCDLNIDIPTGGWRGWGTVLNIPEGEQTKYQLLTFDRINPTGATNWQYGNIYMYEARERNSSEAQYGPEDFHFVRKFCRRLNYSQEILTGMLDLSYRIFLPMGKPYPIVDNKSVTYEQLEDRILVSGHDGTFSLLCGGHLPACEYVLDLTEMQKNETRYLCIGDLDEEILKISFRRSKTDIAVIISGEQLLSLRPQTNYVRIILRGNNASFISE